MKIVCDACQAKYSISDDKVQGKVFKIRCKKCSNIIVVRGGAGAQEAAPAPAQEKDTRVYDYGYEGGEQAPAGDEAVWHVVINQDQVGPMTAAEVQQRFAGGEIDAETYAWREGFADWIPLSQVDAFQGLVASGSTTHAANGEGGASAVAAMFGGGSDEAGTVRSDPGDLFATAGGAGRQAEDDGGDLFGGGKPVTTQAQAQAAANKLRGERNENSVLFSLNNLAQLASDKPIAAAPSGSSGGGGAGHATGQAGGEGSGLIDIRSMASAYLGGSGGGAAKPQTSSAIGSIDDLPVFGGGGFSEPAVIVPTARAQSNSKMMYVLIGSVGLLAVAAIILVVVLLKGGDKKEQVASNDPPKTDEKKPDDVGAKKPDDEKKPDDTAKKPDDTAKKPDDTAKKPDDTAKKPDDTPRKPDVAVKKPDPPKNPTTVKKPDVVAKVDPKKDPPKPDSKPGGQCDEVSCVLSNYEGACCAKFKKGGTTPAKPTVQIGEKPRSDVPEALDRTMIANGVGPVKARVMACGDKSSAKGTVKVSVKVNPDGSIASVSVKQTPDAALGSCVAGAMQRARFQKTQTGGTFGYPFVF
jgi:predicted Zn finger-like uncharacterized protein